MNKKLLLMIALATGTAVQAAQPLTNAVKAGLALGSSAVAAGLYATAKKTSDVTTPAASTVLSEITEQTQKMTGKHIALVAAACAGLYATYKTATWLFGNSANAYKSQTQQMAELLSDTNIQEMVTSKISTTITDPETGGVVVKIEKGIIKQDSRQSYFDARRKKDAYIAAQFTAQIQQQIAAQRNQ